MLVESTRELDGLVIDLPEVPGELGLRRPAGELAKADWWYQARKAAARAVLGSGWFAR